jgi:hypothetical protein
VNKRRETETVSIHEAAEAPQAEQVMSVSRK